MTEGILRHPQEEIFDGRAFSREGVSNPRCERSFWSGLSWQMLEAEAEASADGGPRGPGGILVAPADLGAGAWSPRDLTREGKPCAGGVWGEPWPPSIAFRRGRAADEAILWPSSQKELHFLGAGEAGCLPVVSSKQGGALRC